MSEHISFAVKMPESGGHFFGCLRLPQHTQPVPASSQFSKRFGKFFVILALFRLQTRFWMKRQPLFTFGEKLFMRTAGTESARRNVMK